MSENSNERLDNRKDILLTNIQRYSLHDGPGIRTTVFLKGCGLKCPWCENPENLNMHIEKYYKEGSEFTYGKYMTCEEIYAEVIKDKLFYNEKYNDLNCGYLDGLPGGVTFSGGEALLQVEKIVPLLRMLQNDNIHIALETSLFVSDKQLQIAIEYFDLFYVDIKILDEELCKNIVGGSLHTYLRNVKYLMEHKKDVVFRIPIIPQYTETDENRKKVIDFLKIYKPVKVELLQGHNLGKNKYDNLGLKYSYIGGVNEKYLVEYKRMINEIGILCDICKI